MAATQRTLLFDAPATPALTVVLINPSCSRGYNVNRSCRQCLKRTLEAWGYDAEAYDALALRETGRQRSRVHRQRSYVKGSPEAAARNRRLKYGACGRLYPYGDAAPLWPAPGPPGAGLSWVSLGAVVAVASPYGRVFAVPATL